MDLIEEVALWLGFMLMLVSPALLLRAVGYKWLKLHHTEDELYSQPQSRFIKDLAALNLCPPVDYDAEQRKKWEASWWKYLLASLIGFGVVGWIFYVL
jgi:hypothetical protein